MDGPPLDRDRIAAEALALIDEKGLDAFTMRGLGARLGVEAMALYHHFPAKAVLLDAVAERLLLGLGAPQGRTWRDKLTDTARRYRAIAVEHPNAFLLLTTRRASGPRACAVYEDILAVFKEAGFEGQMLAKAFRLVGYYIGGAGHAEVATRNAAAIAETGSGPPPDPRTFPIMAEAAAHLTRDGLDEVFEFGLAAIIDALDRTRPPGRRGRQPRSS